MTAVEGQPAAGLNGEQPAEPPAAGTPLRRNRDFNVLWSGQALGDLGTQMATIAYPLLVLAVTGSAAQAGIVGSATIAGQLLWLLPAGVAADRWRRKRVLVITALIQLVAGVSVVPAVLSGHVYLAHLATAGFIQGSAVAFFFGAGRGAVRRLVPPEQLATAYARIQARGRAAEMAGPPAGAALFTIARSLPFAAYAVCYAFVALAAALLRRPIDPESDSEPAETRDLRLRQRVMVGLRYVFANPYLRMVTIWATLVNGVIVAVRLAAIVLAKDLGASPTRIGLLFTISALIGLVGAVLATRMIALLGERRLVQSVSFTFPISSVLMAATPSIWLIGVAGGLTGLFLMPLNVVLLSKAAVITPDHLQAQMNNAMTLCYTSLAAVTPALFGLIIDSVGARTTIYITAAIYLAIAVWMLSSPGLKLLQHKAEPSTEAAADDPS